MTDETVILLQTSIRIEWNLYDTNGQKVDPEADGTYTLYGSAANGNRETFTVGAREIRSIVERQSQTETRVARLYDELEIPFVELLLPPPIIAQQPVNLLKSLQYLLPNSATS